MVSKIFHHPENWWKWFSIWVAPIFLKFHPRFDWFFFNDLCSTCMPLQTQHPVWLLCILVDRSKFLKISRSLEFFYVCPVHMIFPTVVMHSPKHRKGCADLFNKSYLEDLDVSYQPWNFSLEPSIIILQKNTPLLRSTRPPKLPSTNRLPVIADNCPACFAAPKERHRDLAFLGGFHNQPHSFDGSIEYQVKNEIFWTNEPISKKTFGKFRLTPDCLSSWFPGVVLSKWVFAQHQVSNFCTQTCGKKWYPRSFCSALDVENVLPS